MHFPRCNQLDFQIVTIENEGPSVFRIELANIGERNEQDGHGPCPYSNKLLGEV